jgi:hypothetical protein
LDRAFEILEFLRVNRQPMRPNEISSETGAPRSPVYELVDLLLSHGMLEYQEGDGRVFLVRRLYFLGTAYAQQFDFMRGMQPHAGPACRGDPGNCPDVPVSPRFAWLRPEKTVSDIECCRRDIRKAGFPLSGEPSCASSGMRAAGGTADCRRDN